MSRNLTLIVLLACLMACSLSSCNFRYWLKVAENGSTILNYQLTITKAEWDDAHSKFPSLPFNLDAKKDFYEASGLKVIKWLNTDAQASLDTLEVEEKGASIDSILAGKNVFFQHNSYTPGTIQGFMADADTYEVRFKAPRRPDYVFSEPNSEVQVLLDFNQQMQFSNGTLDSSGKSVIWNFPLGASKLLKISFVHPNPFLAGVSFLLVIFISFNLILAAVMRGKRKNAK